jgi:hypothetical protein
LASNITLYNLSIWVLPLLLAITFHEAAHAFVAHRLGDKTAWELGRVSFNPIRHIDPFGTLLLPAMLLLSHSPFLFGYAKPVPVNFRALNNRGSTWSSSHWPGPSPISCLRSRRRWPGTPCPSHLRMRRNGSSTT